MQPGVGLYAASADGSAACSGHKKGRRRGLCGAALVGGRMVVSRATWHGEFNVSQRQATSYCGVLTDQSIAMLHNWGSELSLKLFSTAWPPAWTFHAVQGLVPLVHRADASMAPPE